MARHIAASTTIRLPNPPDISINDSGHHAQIATHTTIPIVNARATGRNSSDERIDLQMSPAKIRTTITDVVIGAAVSTTGNNSVYAPTATVPNSAPATAHRSSGQAFRIALFFFRASTKSMSSRDRDVGDIS